MTKVNDRLSGRGKSIADDEIARSVLLGKLDDMVAWGRKNSIWPFGRIDIYKLATFTREHVAAASRRMLEQSAAKSGEKTPDVQRPAYYFAGNDFFAVRKLMSASVGK